MIKEFLTPEDLALLDPTGSGRAAISRLKDSNFTPIPFYVAADPQDEITAYADRISNILSKRHAPYWEYWKEMMTKTGRQGGSVNLQTVEQLYRPFYDNAQLWPTVSFDAVICGRDYLIKRIKQIRYMSDIAVEPYAPVVGTYSGLPAGQEKGTFDAETLGFSASLRHLYPCIPGVRRMRNKTRVINQDANPNVRYIERQVQQCRNFLRKYLPEYFGSWLEPSLYVRPTITRGLQRRFRNIEIDFTHMDEYFNRPIALEIYYPVVEACVGSSLTIEHFLTEVFEQPVFFGSYVLRGNHNWLSGIACTQDAETVYSVCLLLGSLLQAGYDPVKAHILAIGDDSLLQCPPAWDIARIFDILIAETNRNKMQLSVEKCRVDTGDVRYCRNVYYTAGHKTGDGVLIGAYPSCLALNSIVQPERQINDPYQLFVAFTQRADNVVGSPDRELFWDFISSRYLKRLLPKTDLALIDKVTSAEQAITRRDWWYRVYGTPYTIDSSPYLAYWMSKR